MTNANIMAELTTIDEKILSSIETHGWFVIKVFGDEKEPGFAYSIGLFKTFKHPEVIMVGLKLDLMHLLINDIGEEVRKGKKFESQNFYPDIIKNYDCYFTTVGRECYDAYLGRASWFYGNQDFPVLQCVYPAANNTYPWQSECPKAIVNFQPILSGTGTKFPIQQTQNPSDTK